MCVRLLKKRILTSVIFGKELQIGKKRRIRSKKYMKTAGFRGRNFSDSNSAYFTLQEEVIVF